MDAEPSPASPRSSGARPHAPGRALALFSARLGEASPAAALGAKRAGSYLPHALFIALTIGGAWGAAALATAPALTDAMDPHAAIDARAMGLATHLDASGQQTRSATVARDLRALKNEIARLQRALDQSKASQAALSKASSGQTAANQEEVRALKSEIADLQRTLESAREVSAARIDALTAKLDQPKPELERIDELHQRIERIEQAAPPAKAPGTAQAPAPAPAAKVAAPAPETTGSVAQDPGRAVVRNWIVREAADGVALLDGRYGMVEVMKGSNVPGVGRIRSIERRDRQWVVVTDRGLILER